MKHKLFSLFILLTLLATLLGPGFVLAQGPLPPPPTPRPPVPPQVPERESATGKLIPSRALLSEGSSFETLAVGQPGLSFRYLKTFGVTGQPYPEDAAHLNAPYGLFIDGADNLYVVEEKGYRLLEYDSSGANVLIIGHAGLPWHHDDFLSWPKGVAVDASGNMWVVIPNALKEFAPDGTLVQIFPEMDPWESGDGIDRFNDPHGLAFDTAGLLYVADTQNHRVQVYDVSGGTPSYVNTIGVTGEPRSDNMGFDQPSQIAFDSSGRLYVLDTANYRVQRCTYTTDWSCSTFFGITSEPGDDLNHLGWAYGITVDGSDNVFIADSGNYRVLKCDTSAVCSLFAGVTGVTGSDNSHFLWPADVAVDSGGNVYVSDYHNHRIQKFNSSGAFQSRVGVTAVPYVADTDRLNSPWGIAVAPSGNIYVSENLGYRLVKLSASGAQQWTIGKAGVHGAANNRFGDWWTGLEGNVAVDAAERIYVPDTGNQRVQIFNPDGTFFAKIGITREPGSDNAHFDCPAGVAISPVNGDIFVLDRCNQRVQVFTSSRVYKATLGTTGVTGDDNRHFNWPWGVAVDSSGQIYVADSENHRVQKCTLSGSNYSCITFAGETGVFDSDFGHLHPLSVAVDGSGRVYIADEWNSRVQVFNSNGAYLTTIGGSWGSETGQMVSPDGVAVDKAGNVYVTDRDNHRIQKFVRGVAGWTQTNINGFGDRWNEVVFALAPYSGKLYAGTYNFGGGAQLWRSSNGQSWSAVMTGGFGSASNVAIDHLVGFSGNLYASTINCLDDECTTSTGGQIWRSPDGANWSQVVPDGFGDSVNAEIQRMAVFNDQIYAGTWSYDTAAHGTEIWRSGTGDSGSWSRVASDGFGDSENGAVLSFEVYGSYLYAGTLNSATGGEVWRSVSGDAGDWTQVNTDGFGTADNLAITALAVFNNHLYASLRGQPGMGAQVWRCQVCDGSDWVKVVDNGFGDPETRGISGLEVANGKLYFFVRNYNSGMEVWRTANGTSWEQVGFAGFGDSNNWGPYWDNSIAVFNNLLYAGTINYANGGELWRRNPEPVTQKFTSAAAQDGWVLESSENSNKGGSINASQAVFQLGDDAADRQYRAILSFNTAALPDNAVITKVQLKIKKQGLAGTDPFKILGDLKVDIRKGKFGTSAGLQATDFQAAPSKGGVGTFGKTPVSGWYIANIGSTGWPSINLTGITQFRLRFNTDDNDDLGADFMKFYSGNAPAASRPLLIITYTLP